MDPSPGSASGPGDRRPTIGGFDLEAELGRGAMGVVYRARQRATGRAVALKVLIARVAQGETHRERFRREGHVMASLRHPGIVGVHAAGLDGDTAWLACELVEGARTLDQAAAGQPLRRKVELVRDVARALGHAHAAGVVHRDVKPANVLVDGTGRVRVADFGLALAEERERLTRTGQIVGTPAYMAPEQLLGERALGPPCDVWALGVVLHELLAGRLPFEEESFVEQARAIATRAPLPPSAHAPEVPAALDAVVLAALGRAPEERPRDGEALAAQLDTWLAGGTPSAALDARAAARARRLRVALGGLLVLALGLGTLVALAVQRRRADRAALAEACERDGAACLAGERACAGGPHLLAAWNLGAGPGEPPTRAALSAEVAALEALTPRLRDPDLRSGAASLRLRLLAHARLLGEARAPGTSPTDLFVNALLAAREPSAGPGAVVAALASAAACVVRVPGDDEALLRAVDGLLALPTPPAAAEVAALLSSAPVARRPLLSSRVRTWVDERIATDMAALREGSLRSLWSLEALVELGAVTGEPGRVEHRLVSGPGDDAPTSFDAERLWKRLLPELRSEPTAVVVDRLRRACERVDPGSSVAALRALRLAGVRELLHQEAEQLVVALRFDAEACRLDPRGSLVLARPEVERVLRDLADRPGAVGAEVRAALARVAPVDPVFTMPRQVPAMKRLREERPWSRAVRAAGLVHAAWNSPLGRALEAAELLDVYAAPVDDLADGMHEHLLINLANRAYNGCRERYAAGSERSTSSELTVATWSSLRARPVPASLHSTVVVALVARCLEAGGRPPAAELVRLLRAEAPLPWVEPREWRGVIGLGCVLLERALALEDSDKELLLRAAIAECTGKEAALLDLDENGNGLPEVRLARVLLRKGDGAAAAAALSRVVRSTKGYTEEVVLAAVDALIAKGRPDEAMKFADEAIKAWEGVARSAGTETVLSSLKVARAHAAEAAAR